LNLPDPPLDGPYRHPDVDIHSPREIFVEVKHIVDDQYQPVGVSVGKSPAAPNAASSPADLDSRSPITP
jgi:hypothetical protein